MVQYGDPQGLFRQIPAAALNWGSGLENDTSTWVAGYVSGFSRCARLFLLVVLVVADASPV